MSKLCIISGGSKGIGRAIAEVFAKKGFDLLLISRSKDALNEVKKELQKAYKIKIFIQKADVSKQKEVKRVVEFALHLNQKIDILVNNAGVFIPSQLHNEPDGTLEQLIETNLYSAYYLTKGLLPAMLAQKEGHIFCICSVASITAYPSGGAYSISKHALLGFTKSLREELKDKGIRVTAILPGATFTDSWAGVEIPVERFMPAEDVAKSVWAAYELSKQSVVEEILIRPQLGDI